jgi:hypothetical protein
MALAEWEEQEQHRELGGATCLERLVVELANVRGDLYSAGLAAFLSLHKFQPHPDRSIAHRLFSVHAKGN